MAEKDVVASAAEPPKPVHIGGESFADRVRPHIKQILVVTVVLSVVLCIVFGVRWWRERKAIASTERLDQVLMVAQQPVRTAGEPADPKTPSFASAKERAAAVLDTIAKQNIDAPIAFRAGMLLDVGKFDEAIAEYKRGATGKQIDNVLCREGLGLAIEAKASADKDAAARQKGFEEALAAFVAMQPEETGLRRAYALYHQARVQLLLGKRAEAKDLFEKAKTAAKDDHDIAMQIEQRLADLGAS
jgi:tetratricopeptide (TPR) repeat protein